MAYQPSWVIWCQGYPCRRTAVILFKHLLGGEYGGLCLCDVYIVFVVLSCNVVLWKTTLFVFNWNHFEMRLLNLRINFFIYCGLFVLILVVFVLFLLSQRFGQISPLAFFRWLTATSDRNAESCNRIPSNYCSMVPGEHC